MKKLLDYGGFDLDCHAFYRIAEDLYQDLAPQSSYSFDPVNVHKGPNRLAIEEEYLRPLT
jgi:hypothetical protein